MTAYHDSFTNEQLHHALARAVAERDEARDALRALYWAGYELRRFARAYADDYDEVDGKQGAEKADDAFYEASISVAKILGEEEGAK